MRKTLMALALICASAAASSPARAEIRALVVGINDYAHMRKLLGAVADARDIDASLRRFGAQDVTLLLDRQANRDAVEGAWRSMVARASAGDTLVFTYAGHGSQEPDLNGDEARVLPGDVTDENFILSGYSRSNLRERIVDDDLSVWFMEALSKGVKVLFVADSCHSGTMYRSISGEPPPEAAGRSSPEAAALLERTPNIREVTSAAALNPLPPEASPENHPNFFFVSAIEQAHVVLEATIGGEKRGALSYAFARALDGAADHNKDGVLDHLELGHYLETVSVAHDDTSRREFLPRGGPPRDVLTRPFKPGEGAPVDLRPGAPSDLRLELRGTASSSLGAISGVQIVTQAPDLIYDADRMEVLDSQGVMTADNVRSLAQELQPILDKYRLVTFVREMATASPLQAEFSPAAPGGFYVIGDRVSARVPQGGRPWLTAFNLANKGEVQNIFPHKPGEETHQLSRTPFSFDADIAEPIGADHLILIASDQEPTALRSALRSRAKAPQILEILRQMSVAGGVSANVLPFYTRRTR